jgi:guanylate kinase
MAIPPEANRIVPNPPLLVVLSGPSGVGKTSICERLVESLDDAVYSISATTRPMREGEVDGDEYLFMTRKEFESQITRGNLLEWAEVHGHYYGTPRTFVEDRLGEGRVVVLNIDVQGGVNVMSSYPDGAFVFVLPPSLEDLLTRIRGRGDSDQRAIELRMKNAPGEIAEAEKYTYIVVNDELEACVERIRAIITAERCLRRRCLTEDEARVRPH